MKTLQKKIKKRLHEILKICLMDFPSTKHNIFSLQQIEDLVVHDHPTLISFEQENHTPDLHEHYSMMEGMYKTNTNLPSSSTRKKSGNLVWSKPNFDATAAGGDDEDVRKKKVHREMERQRRQEMNKLYASLKDLLPPEFIKGNRSVSDHMNQAVHYIKQKQENIKKISMKRDLLNQLVDTEESSMNHLPNTVLVNFCDRGVEILIKSCSMEEGFALSHVLNVVVEEGLNIISCSSTKVNDQLLHSIQSEPSDLALIDLSMLKQRLVSVANTRQNFNSKRLNSYMKNSKFAFPSS